MRALVFSIDDAYVMPFKVLWHSLMKTESVPDHVPVFILHTETLSPVSIKSVADFLRQHGRTATFKDASSFVPDDVPISHHFSKANYYRLYVSSILTEDVTSVVYLDSDAVVCRSIRDLFDLNMTHPIAAADHMTPREGFRLWGEMVGNYFQSGVLLIDLKIWRRNHFEEVYNRILSEQRSRILWVDQDVLNIAFENNWQRLPIWYNLSRQARSEIPKAAAIENGCFLHLDGSGKPWKIHSKDWVVDAWYALYFETFGEEFDKKSIQRPLWQRSLSASKRIVKCVLGRA